MKKFNQPSIAPRDKHFKRLKIDVELSSEQFDIDNQSIILHINANFDKFSIKSTIESNDSNLQIHKDDEENYILSVTDLSSRTITITIIVTDIRYYQKQEINIDIAVIEPQIDEGIVQTYNTSFSLIQ